MTSRLRLGTLVASANFRHPVPFARELITVDHISGGRLTVGLGSGGVGWDTTMLGQPAWSPQERVARFAEFVGLLDDLLRHPETTAQGEFWKAVEARMYPGCLQAPRVPFAIAATGRRSMEVAARYASIWVTNGDRRHSGAPLGPDEGAAVVARQLARFEEVCADVDRDPAEIDRLVLTGPRLDPGMGSASQFAEVVAAYAAVGTTDLVVHYPRQTDPYAGDDSVLDVVAKHATSVSEGTTGDRRSHVSPGAAGRTV